MSISKDAIKQCLISKQREESLRLLPLAPKGAFMRCLHALTLGRHDIPLAHLRPRCSQRGALGCLYHYHL